MRTKEDCIQQAIQADGGFAFSKEAVISFLTFDEAKPFLKSEATPDDWPDPRPWTRRAVLEQMREYMTFAWDKASHGRGLSASRSIEKFEMWLYMIGDDETRLKVMDAPFAMYGAPGLAIICRKYDFPIPDDPHVAHLIAGDECSKGCPQSEWAGGRWR